MSYNKNSIADKIGSGYNSLDRNLVAKWNSIRDILRTKYVTTEMSVNTVAAERYKFDLYGLFLNEFNIPTIQIYPHMIVNGYMSSYDYYGELLRFKIIDGNILRQYHRLFTRE